MKGSIDLLPGRLPQAIILNVFNDTDDFEPSRRLFRAFAEGNRFPIGFSPGAKFLDTNSVSTSATIGAPLRSFAENERPFSTCIPIVLK
jgi:hypothetical protein